MSYGTNQSSPTEDHIKHDHSINNNGVGQLSVQYKRNPEQVPFKYSVRGPATIRSRNTPYKVTKG